MAPTTPTNAQRKSLSSCDYILIVIPYPFQRSVQSPPQEISQRTCPHYGRCTPDQRKCQDTQR
ncbi:hypothetical protein PILCRDRAFT_468326 [Piloderma croceum F 1598]|uniref:Uncharacterized protein n=1 Tax=Piloderma croceum (strain F 1598) TaxID=765440 RepID=A0A0C3FSH7_PILCF|nr:hypothetical protein PILCRDRAFT_468326 [Piloderma croceum F 1598]